MTRRLKRIWKPTSRDMYEETDWPDVHSVGISGGLGLLTLHTICHCMFLEFVRLVSPPQTSVLQLAFLHQLCCNFCYY